MESRDLERQARRAAWCFGGAGTVFLLIAVFSYDVASLAVAVIGWVGTLLCLDQARRIRE